MNAITVLYVDDEPDALRAMKVGMEDRGYTMTTAGSGPEALELLKTFKPDIIITDLRMQPMNGFELLQQVKKDPQFAQTPVFFLTAVDDFLAQKYGQTVGVDAYIVKPVDLDNLDSIIKGKVKRA